MQRLGDVLLAGPGLALEQHRAVALRHRPQLHEQLAHGHRAAAGVAELRPRRRRHLSLLVGGRDAQHSLAQLQLHRLHHRQLAHAGGAHVGAVGRIEVDDAIALGDHADLEVLLGDGGIGEHQVVAGLRPDAEERA